jgi:hypothetical protein
MIKNSTFKKVFLTQLTGIFWFNIFYLKEGNSTSLYFSTLISLLSLAILTHIISVQKINQFVRMCPQWLRKKVRNKPNQMTEELPER